MELLSSVLDSGQWGGFHEIVSRFESEFAAHQHCRHGIAAANGTVTLELALQLCGVQPGDEVIVPAISFVSTATAVSRIGGIPVFVDIEPHSFNVDPLRVAGAITARTKALLLVHFGGPMARMDALLQIADKKGLVVLEDAAHAHGSEWCGKRAGSFGISGSFSFQNGKVMTAGEGGILTTNDDQFASKARSLVNQGRREGESYFCHYEIASNYRMTGLQAAVLTAQLERLPEQTAKRRQNEALLRSELADLKWLIFQEVPREASVHSHYLVLGRVDGRLGRSRDELHRDLTARGVPCTPFYPHPLYGNPVYKTAPCRVAPCPVAEACVNDAFWLPHRVLLGDESYIRSVAQIIRGNG